MKNLRVEKADAITTVYLNRPSKLNSLTSELIDELRALIDQLRDDASTRTIILTGSGKSFSSGADVDMLALACDFRLASTRAIFGLPEIKLGMVLALGGTQRLTRLVGVSVAKEMILRGRNVTAIESQRMGLVHRITDPGDLMGVARSWAERAVANSPLALALAKRLIDQSFERDANASAEAETAAQVELLHSPEFLGRIKALKDSGEI